VLREYLIKFENFREFYELDDIEATMYLKQNLVGRAAEVLSCLHRNSSLENIIAELRKRFTREDHEAFYRQAFRSRRQGKQESLQNLYLDLLHTCSQAYPGQTGPVIERLLADTYVDALYDQRLKRKLLQIGPSTISEAHSHYSHQESR
jgi:regulator of replication initiation timing